MNMTTPSRLLRRALLATTCLTTLGLSGIALIPSAQASQAMPREGVLQACHATWYGAPGEIPEGWPTASGEGFHRMALRAANNSLPFGTKVRVTYQGKSVTVKINDRGNFGPPVCLDLTYGAFKKIGNPDLGNVEVHYKVL